MNSITHMVRLRFDPKYALAAAREHYETVRARYAEGFASEQAADRWMRDMAYAGEAIQDVYRKWPHL